MEAIDNFIMKNLNPLGFDDDKIKLVLYFVNLCGYFLVFNYTLRVCF